MARVAPITINGSFFFFDFGVSGVGIEIEVVSLVESSGTDIEVVSSVESSVADTDTEESVLVSSSGIVVLGTIGSTTSSTTTVSETTLSDSGCSDIKAEAVSIT